MIQQFKNIWQWRDLLFYLVLFQIKAENKSKVLGFFWSLLDPLLLLITYVILVQVIFARGGPQYPILLFSALLSWKWFASSLSRSVTSISSKAKLVTSTRFPLAILPLSGIIVGFVDWLFGFVILVPMLFFFKVTLTANLLWIPVLLFIQLIGTIGLCLICTVLGTYLSDLSNIIQFAIRICFYLSPILYTVSDRIPQKYATTYMLINPFSGLLESYKNVLIRGLPPSEYVFVAIGVSIVLFWAGFLFFTHDERKLAKAI